jgi:hypothetical protein
MRTQCSFFTAPFAPLNFVVITAKSRSTPSSWLDDVRSFNGQSGQDLEISYRQRALAKGGTDAVRSGIAAADHDHMLPSRQDRLALDWRFAADPPVLLRQIIHGEVNALELAPWHRQFARLFGPAGEHDRVVLRKELMRVEIDTDMSAVMKHDAFRLHLRDTPVDVMLLHLEIRNAVAQEAACLGPALIDVNVMSGAGKLLCTGKTGRAGSDDCYCLAGAFGRRLWL